MTQVAGSVATIVVARVRRECLAITVKFFTRLTITKYDPCWYMDPHGRDKSNQGPDRNL